MWPEWSFPRQFWGSAVRETRSRRRTNLEERLDRAAVDALELPADGLTLITYTAPADSPAQEQLDFLASWSVDHHRGNQPASSGQALNPVRTLRPENQ